MVEYCYKKFTISLLSRVHTMDVSKRGLLQYFIDPAINHAIRLVSWSVQTSEKRGHTAKKKERKKRSPAPIAHLFVNLLSCYLGAWNRLTIQLVVSCIFYLT